MPDWPRTLHPVRPDRRGDGLVLDEAAATAEVFQLEPGGAEAVQAWLADRGLPPLLATSAAGGPVLVLSAEAGAIGLGDYAVIQDGEVFALPGGDLHNRFQHDPPVEKES